MGYYEKRIQSGPYLEVYRYHALRSPGKQTPRGPAERDTTEYQDELNSVAAWKKLLRLVLCNFSRAAGDLFVTVTHRDRITEADALREERNLIARLKRLRKRLGLSELKYIAVTEEQGRWHTHLILNGGLTLEQLVRVWGDRGRVAVSTLISIHSPRMGRDSKRTQLFEEKNWRICTTLYLFASKEVLPADKKTF